MKIGIVGAENSHCAHIAKSLNVEKDVPGWEVTHVWGETAEFAAKAAKEGQIPNIVTDYTEMIGQVHGVAIDHRDGKHHLAAARPFIEAGIPVFVDKPFCTDLAEGIDVVRLARAKGVPITSYSVLSLQQSVLTFAEAIKKLGGLRALVTAGPCDVESEYGGVSFYGIHQVDLVCTLLGAEPVEVSTARHGADAVAIVTFATGPVVTFVLLKDIWKPGFTASAYGDEGAHYSELPFDQKTYLAGIRTFCRMFETRQEPLPPVAYLRPVAILEAMQKSLDTAKPVKVKPIPTF
jgi:predicted dehydrogenase